MRVLEDREYGGIVRGARAGRAAKGDVTVMPISDRAQAMEERVLGKDVASHLRQAARSVLQAGLAALDERARRAGATAEPSKPACDQCQ